MGTGIEQLAPFVLLLLIHPPSRQAPANLSVSSWFIHSELECGSETVPRSPSGGPLVETPQCQRWKWIRRQRRQERIPVRREQPSPPLGILEASLYASNTITSPATSSSSRLIPEPCSPCAGTSQPSLHLCVSMSHSAGAVLSSLLSSPSPHLLLFLNPPPGFTSSAGGIIIPSVTQASIPTSLSSLFLTSRPKYLLMAVVCHPGRKTESSGF